MGAATEPVRVAVLGEPRVEHGIEDVEAGALRDPIAHGDDPDGAPSAVGLRDEHPTQRQRPVGLGAQLTGEAVDLRIDRPGERPDRHHVSAMAVAGPGAHSLPGASQARRGRDAIEEVLARLRPMDSVSRRVREVPGDRLARLRQTQRLRRERERGEAPTFP